MKKLISIILFALVSVNFSCTQKTICNIDNESLYFSQGIANGFTIQLVNVSKFDTNGVPTEYKEDVIRTDFVNEVSKKINRIYFLKENANSHWSYQLSEKFNTIPIEFEKGKWYIITSNEFKKGIFQNIYFRFFIYKDSSNKFHLFQSSEAVSPI